jgi:hypothetical protein
LHVLGSRISGYFLGLKNLSLPHELDVIEIATDGAVALTSYFVVEPKSMALFAISVVAHLLLPLSNCSVRQPYTP